MSNQPTNSDLAIESVAARDFCIVGRVRNSANILEVCHLLKRFNKSYYCFAENEQSHARAGLNLHDHPDKLASDYESLDLGGNSIRIFFEEDLAGLKNCNNLIMVLPAGKSSHIEAGIAYGLGKTCYAIGEYDITDSLYLIFDQIFPTLAHFEKFLATNSLPPTNI